MPTQVLSHRARIALIASAAVTLALYLVPYGHHVAYPLLLISTLVHELGHGIAAVLMGGDFIEMEMRADGSGVAYHTGAAAGAARAFVSAGGLCGPAVAAAGMFALAPNLKHARWALGAFGAVIALALLLVVRTWFGAGFCVVLAGSTLLIAIYGSAQLAQGTLLFLAVQLALSVYSRGDYLFMQWADEARQLPSDSQQMAQAMGGSYWFWGGACAVFSAIVLLAGAFLFWRATASRSRS